MHGTECEGPPMSLVRPSVRVTLQRHTMFCRVIECFIVMSLLIVETVLHTVIIV